jgi:Tfp pilus assembly protein PilO
MRRQVLIAAGTAIVLALLLFFALIKPKVSDVAKVNVNIAAEKKTEQDLRLKRRQLEAARASAPATQAKLATFNALLPSTPDLATFIRQAQAAASREGVDLTSIAPSPPTPLQATGGKASIVGVETLSVNLNVVAGFFRLESFLSRLEDLPRVTEVRSLAVTPTTDQATGFFTLQSTITLTMYVVQPGAQAPAGSLPQPSVPSPAASASPSASPSPSPSASAGG